MGLRGPRDEDPAYIKGTLFGRALLETFAPVGDGGLAKALVASIDDKRIRSLLHSLASDSKMTVDALCREIGRWFDEAMISATAEYRRSAQWRLLGIALVATVAMNVDTRAVAQALWSDGSALDTPLPLGWSGDVLRDGPGQWLLRIAGWLLTAIATALGAPFWFELMTRLMRLRSETRSEPSPKGESAP